MKYLKTYSILFLCFIFEISCGTKSSSDSASEEGEYKVEESITCEGCYGDGVVSIPCSKCNGSGITITYYIEKKSVPITCSSCGGFGRLRCAHCMGTDKQKCGSCSGRGIRKCPGCNGTGVLVGPLDIKDCPFCDRTGLMRCSSCKGKGVTDCFHCNSGTILCEDCWGRGHRYEPRTERGTRENICEKCEGSKYFERVCQKCNGKGKITVIKVYDKKTNNLIREERE